MEQRDILFYAIPYSCSSRQGPRTEDEMEGIQGPGKVKISKMALMALMEVERNRYLLGRARDVNIHRMSCCAV